MIKKFGPLTALMLLIATMAGAESSVSPDTYLQLAIDTYERESELVPPRIDDWIENYNPTVIYGYGPPPWPVWMGGLAGSLYDLTGEEHYALDAATWIASIDRFKEFFPDSIRLQRPELLAGLPACTDFFHLPAISQAYSRIKSSASITPELHSRIARNIAESADYMFYYPEWGTMNRAALRAQGLQAAALALPSHPNRDKWIKLAKILAGDNLHSWSEEDAQIYHPVWMHAMISYADLAGLDSYFDSPVVRFYCKYFVHLLDPTGMVPEFGDARWQESWPSYLVCLERAAAEYDDGELKWGANRIASKMLPRYGDQMGCRTAMLFTDIYRWSDTTIAATAPTVGSEEVLEDMIGKKIVFRSGWSDDDSFLMLNYRDEGPFARIQRDFLRWTIPVEEEKMHHGHSDENAICLLMSGGSVLLHNPGYRDKIPSGDYGAFRADYFHNSFVGRNGKRGRPQPLFEFLRHSGGYRSITTEKIDFLSLTDVDMSRTRIIDQQRGYESDRVIVYLKDENIFLVFDIAKIRETGYYTFSTLWHGTTLLNRGDHHYVTAVDSILSYKPPQDQALLINFLQKGIRSDGVFPIRRARQDELAVYQTISSHYIAGQVETFVTALVPIVRGTQPTIIDKMEILPVGIDRAGVGVRLELEGDVHFVCIKTDLERELLAENVRPRYTFEKGRVVYGPIETDAHFMYGKLTGGELSYAAANMVKIIYSGKEIFAARPNTFGLMPDDLGCGFGPAKWRYWEDTVATQ
jgi:hypothetical protein